jgi:hypothetical protein
LLQEEKEFPTVSRKSVLSQRSQHKSNRNLKLMPVIPASWKVRQEDCRKFEAILSYIVSDCFKKKKEKIIYKIYGKIQPVLTYSQNQHLQFVCSLSSLRSNSSMESLVYPSRAFFLFKEWSPCPRQVLNLLCTSVCWASSTPNFHPLVCAGECMCIHASF